MSTPANYSVSQEDYSRRALIAAIQRGEADTAYGWTRILMRIMHSVFGGR